MKKIQLSSLEDEESMSNKHQDVCDMCNVRLACFCHLVYFIESCIYTRSVPVHCHATEAEKFSMQ